MENFDENVYDRVVVNSDPDFIENDSGNVSASYVILCEQNFDNENSRMYEQKIAGISLAEWVSMACETKPTFLTIDKNEKLVNFIKPCLSEKDYLVVLYADTPLVSKTHLKDLLCYVDRKRLNVCKLKRGFILKNSYAKQVDDFYFGLVYDLSTNDFFQVKTFNDIDKVKSTLESRMFNYHKKNGVFFENQNTTVVDANVKIGKGSFISAGSTILDGSVIGENVFIGNNVYISNSNIWVGSKVFSKSVIENSIVKDNSKIGLDSLLSYSVISSETEIGVSSRFVKSAIGENCIIGNFCNFENANVLNGAKIGSYSAVIGENVTINIEEKAVISAGSKIVKKEE